MGGLAGFGADVLLSPTSLTASGDGQGGLSEVAAGGIPESESRVLRGGPCSPSSAGSSSSKPENSSSRSLSDI